uniref:Small nuclear RNA activating complex polypeptide 2 n=1 Tax=Spermophilus dauricus TaxID=99837 RepID=A0A8C9QIY2_SPEDA
MKPPQRRRAAPARYLGEVTLPWGCGLRFSSASLNSTGPFGLLFSPQIRAFLQQLKDRVVREAIQRVHPGGPKRREAEPPAPIEVWMDLVEKITDITMDFEKIYKYLSCCSRSGHVPELSAAESAVVLDLLLSLPEELPRLPCTALIEHMTKTYAHLMAPQPSPSGRSPGPGAEDGSACSQGPEEPSQTSPHTPEQATPGEPRSAWQAAGICPLNPFLVPLELLGQAATPTR